MSPTPALNAVKCFLHASRCSPCRRRGPGLRSSPFGDSSSYTSTTPSSRSRRGWRWLSRREVSNPAEHSTKSTLRKHAQVINNPTKSPIFSSIPLIKFLCEFFLYLCCLPHLVWNEKFETQVFKSSIQMGCHLLVFPPGLLQTLEGDKEKSMTPFMTGVPQPQLSSYFKRISNGNNGNWIDLLTILKPSLIVLCTAFSSCKTKIQVLNYSFKLRLEIQVDSQWFQDTGQVLN